MTFELVADGSPNQIGTIRVKTLLHQEIDVAEVDIAEIARDLLAVSDLRSKLVGHLGPIYHPYAIRVDGKWMV